MPFGQLSTLSRIIILIVLILISLVRPLSAMAALPLCYSSSDYQTAEVSTEEVRKLQDGALTVSLSLPLTCRLIPGEVYLFERSTKDQKKELPILWAKAIFKKDQDPLWVTDVYQGTRLAPTCLGACSRVSHSLMAKSTEEILDLRSSASPFPLIPNLKTAAELSNQKTLTSMKNLVFLLNSNRLDEKGNWQSFRDYQDKGHSQTVWYYPGFEGLTHTVEWMERRHDLPLVTPQNLEALRKDKVRFLYVGKSPLRGSEPALGTTTKVEILHTSQNFEFTVSEQEKLATLFSTGPKTSWILITETDEATRWSDLVADIFSMVNSMVNSMTSQSSSTANPNPPRLYRWRGSLPALAKLSAPSPLTSSQTLKPLQTPAANQAPRPSASDGSCPLESLLFYLRDNEMTALAEEGQVRLIRNSSGHHKDCPALGQRVLLARYESAVHLGFLLGTAEVFTKDHSKKLTLTLGRADLSWRESDLLAPLCKDCEIRFLPPEAAAARVPENVLDVGPQPFPAPSQGQVLSWRRPWSEIQSLTDLNELLPVKPNQGANLPLALWSSFPQLPLRELLNHFSQQKSKPWAWYFPDPFSLIQRPPSVPGVVEISLDWFKELEKEKIHMVSLVDLPESIWAGSKTQILDPLATPFEALNRRQTLRRQDLTATITSLLSPLQKTHRNRIPLLVLSKGGFDFSSFYLVEGLKQMGYEQIYWLRTSGINAKRKVSFDAPPAPLYPVHTWSPSR